MLVHFKIPTGHKRWKNKNAHVITSVLLLYLLNNCMHEVKSKTCKLAVNESIKKYHLSTTLDLFIKYKKKQVYTMCNTISAMCSCNYSFVDENVSYIVYIYFADKLICYPWNQLPLDDLPTLIYINKFSPNKTHALRTEKFLLLRAIIVCRGKKSCTNITWFHLATKFCLVNWFNVIEKIPHSITSWYIRNSTGILETV